MNQEDNLIQYSHHFNNQYDYQSKTIKYNRQKQQNQAQLSRKYNNDINYIQRSEHNSQNQISNFFFIQSRATHLK